MVVHFVFLCLFSKTRSLIAILLSPFLLSESCSNSTFELRCEYQFYPTKVQKVLFMQRCISNWDEVLLGSSGEITTWWWIHTCHQHKTCRIIHRKSRSGNRHFSVFQRLTHYFQNCSFKFWHFIQKQRRHYVPKKFRQVEDNFRRQLEYVRNRVMPDF